MVASNLKKVDSYLEGMALTLKAHGYIVFKKERRVILHNTYVVPQYEIQRNRSGAERMLDSAVEHNVRCIARGMVENGLVVNQIRHVNDAVTGAETYINTAVALIKPKEGE